MFKRVFKITFVASCILLSYQLYGLPEGGDVVSGSATIQQPDTSTLLINQSSDKAIINWNQFNINTGELTQFVVPTETSITLNRVIGASPSEILGALKSNGQLWLINPNGIIFGSNAQVNVAGLVASTLNIQNEDFLKGNYKLQSANNSTTTTAQIINQGTIVARDSGVIALLAPQVQNQGILVANLGTVAIGTGNQVTLNFAGNQLLNFSVSDGAASDFYDTNGNRIASLSNSGKIIANGGKVLLTSQNIDQVLNESINTSGIIQANTETMRNGKIALIGAGDTIVSGKLSATGLNSGETGGSIDVLGNRVGLLDQANINTSGAAGGGQIRIGGDYQGANPDIQNSTQTYIGPNTIINASATQNGNGGNVYIWGDQTTQFYGSIFSQGGAQGGNGGLIETSGKQYLDAQGSVNTLAANGQAGTWLLDPADLTISSAAQNNVGGSGSSGSPFIPSAPFTSSNLNTTTLLAALQTSNVTVQTGGDAASGSGNITISSPIAYASNSNFTLTLNAYGSIAVNASISDNNSSTTGALSLVMNAGTGSGTQASPASITFAGTNPVAIHGTLTGTAGTSGPSGFAGAINVNGVVSTTGPINLTNYGSGTSDVITFGSSGSLTSTAGSVNLTSTQNAGSTANNLNMTVGSISANAANQNITLNTSGNITQNASTTLSATGTNGTLNVNTGSSSIGTATLNSSTNNFNQLGITSGNATVNNGATPNTLTLLSSNVGNNFTLTTLRGLTQSAPLTVGGIFNLTTGNAWSLTNASNSFNTLQIISGTGSGSAFSLVNSNTGTLTLNNIGSGSFNITSAGAIVQSGTLLAQFGASSLQGTSITLNNTTTMSSGNAGNLTLTATNGGISEGASGVIAFSGSGGLVLSASGTGNNITLNGANTISGLTISNGNNVSVTNTGALSLGASTVGGTLGISNTGAITQSGALAVTGATTLAAGSANNITLTNTSNAFNNSGTGGVGITSGNNITLYNNGAIALNASTVTGNLTVDTTQGAAAGGASPKMALYRWVV